MDRTRLLYVELHTGLLSALTDEDLNNHVVIFDRGPLEKALTDTNWYEVTKVSL